MKITTTTAVLSLVLCCTSTAQADTFGSGANAFDIDFVTIGSPHNVDDTTGFPNPAGKVDYTYRIGKFEISEDRIDKANAQSGLTITHDNRGANKPATSITWFDAAQFVNWLNTESGGAPAYKFDSSGKFLLWESDDAGYNPNNLYRNKLATYFLPSMDEWYKAAYYNSATDSYGDFPTASGLAPTAVVSGTAVNTAVFGQLSTEPADVTQAGGLSPFGTMGQGGNVFEWGETDVDLTAGFGSTARLVRGGSWGSFLSSSQSSLFHDSFGFPSVVSANRGFRVASIPEPSTLLLGALATLGLLMRRRRLSVRIFSIASSVSNIR